MNIEWVRRHCMSFPHAAESLQWESLVFKIGGKMFAIAALEPGKVWLSFKCSPADFADLTELPGIIPAPYLARAQWVGIETEDALPVAEIRRLLRQAYEVTVARLPRKTRVALG